MKNNEKKPIFILKGNKGPINSLAISSDNNRIITRCNNGNNYVWEKPFY